MVKVQYKSKWFNPLYWKITNVKRRLKPIVIVCIQEWPAPKSSLILPLKMAPNFEAVFGVLLQIYGQIFRGMPYLCIFVEEVVPLLGAMTDKLVLTFVWVRIGT